MRRVALAAAGLVMFAGPAFAQYYGPRPAVPIGPMPADEVVGIVRAMGLDPVGVPMRAGHVFVQRASDYYGKPLRVIVDAHRAQVVSVEPFGAPGSIYGGPYAATGAPHWRRPHRAAVPMDDEFDSRRSVRRWVRTGRRRTRSRTCSSRRCSSRRCSSRRCSSRSPRRSPPRSRRCARRSRASAPPRRRRRPPDRSSRCRPRRRLKRLPRSPRLQQRRLRNPRPR